MPIISSRVVVGNTPTLLINPVNGSVTGSITAIVKNAGPTSVFIGGEFVTAAQGFELAAGGTVDVDLIAGDLLYGITGSGTQEVQTIKLMS